jgi:hypothetical protein
VGRTGSNNLNATGAQENGRSKFLAVIALLPALALAALSLYWALGAVGGHGLWPADDVTLPEAVATRNSAEAARLIGLGQNPNARDRVRAGILAGHDIWVTPLEAAVWTRDANLVKMLLNYGAVTDRREARILRCIAGAAAGREMHDVLAGLSSEDWPACDEVEIPTER